MKNEEFIKVIKSFITGNNKVIEPFIDLKVVMADQIPQLAIKTTDDVDELAILALHLNFITEIANPKAPKKKQVTHLEDVIKSNIPNKDTATKMLKEALRVVEELGNQINTKLKRY